MRTIILLSIKFLLCKADYIRIKHSGENCVLPYNLAEGVCKPIKECPSVTNLLKNTGIRPETCSFDGNGPIVCCPLGGKKNESSTKSATTPSTRYINLDINERISKKKCSEYNICTYEKIPEIHIVGGKMAKLNEFPHMVAIGWPKKDGGMVWNCGGSLISENYILTAAHCTQIFLDTTLNSTEPTIARLGEYNLINDKDGAVVQDLPIVNITLHPQYKPPRKYHDIALMQLGRAATFTKGVRPACLWQSTTFPRSYIYATGWGSLGYMEESSDILQRVILKLMNSTNCQSSFGNLKALPNGIADEQLCAKGYKGQDTCQGDSGGPLQIKDEDYPCSFHLIGITSFGIGCGTKDIPGVYTRVSSYLDWIEGIVWPN